MVVLEAFTYQVERIAFRVKTTSFHIDAPTTGHTMASLALALAIGGDDASDIGLLNPLVATGFMDKIPSDSTNSTIPVRRMNSVLN